MFAGVEVACVTDRQNRRYGLYRDFVTHPAARQARVEDTKIFA